MLRHNELSRKCPANLVGPLIKIVIDEIRKACKKEPLSCGFNPSDNAYEPLRLMQTVMAKTNEVCLRYLDNSMLCSLPSPGPPYFQTSVCAIKNSRRRMEDRHVVIHDLNSMFNIPEASPSSYYAVFDGHAGHDAAAYSAAHLHQFLAENKHFISNPEQALLDAFCKTDALFTDKCRVENLSSGTTAVVALLRPKEKTLYIAWVGDSQALLVNQGRLLQVVNPHKPSRQDERERIEKQGGCVVMWGTWRVNGQLAVSRAIGDAEYKPSVIAIPDVREIPLDGGEDFLILACDGLWDFVSEDMAARTVYNLITENPGDVDRISHHLVQLSREQGSSDNISVIVVFLREPSKIAAEAHWANRNPTSTTMDAGLDNANNPFAIPNGAPTDNIISQKSDGLLLNLTDNFKQNGTDISPTADFYPKEKTNGKRSASEFDEDDFGPETDVDAVDDVMSPMETAKGFGEVFSNNNPAEGVCNPFIEHQEKAALEIERELQKQMSDDLEETRLAREETPTPPADAVHDVSGLVENTAESDSEDEWNYFKGEEANKENISPQPEKEVAEVPEEDDTMSQLNPNAAEFIPVSPTRSISSPISQTLLNDEVISQSPRRAPNDIDISVPNRKDFMKEVKSRPGELDSYSNGHDENGHNIPPNDLMENLLNGKNIDEIPEFQPGSTPSKTVPSDEFHFGPNATPFTPAKFLDQSETGLSTRAVYGDESTATLGTSFNESISSQDTAADINLLNKDSDPMSTSFYADKGESNPFDLNKVQELPDNIDEFLSKPDNNSFNITISDLPEHHPLGELQSTAINNDDAIQTTDLDKQSYDDEKELASPMEAEKEISEALGGSEECDQSKTPEPTHENLLGQEFCCVIDPAKLPQTESLPRDVELISPDPGSRQSEPVSSRPESSHENLELNSPLPEATEVADLLQSQPESLPDDVELIPSELKSSRPPSSLTHEDSAKSPRPEATEVDDLLGIESKSPAPVATEVNDLLGRPDSVQSSISETNEVNDLLKTESKSPLPASDSKSPEPDDYNPLETTSPVCERPVLESPVQPISESPVCNLAGTVSSLDEPPSSKSLVAELETSKSPIPEVDTSRSSIPELEAITPPISRVDTSRSPLPEEEEVSKSPVPELEDSRSAFLGVESTKYPVCDISLSRSPDLFKSHSPVPMEPTTPDFTKEEDIAKAYQHFETICKSPEEDFGQTTGDFTKLDEIEKAEEHFNQVFKEDERIQSPQEDVTSSLKDEVSAASPLLDQAEEEIFEAKHVALESNVMENILDAVQESSVPTARSPVPELEPLSVPTAASPVGEVDIAESCSLAPPGSSAQKELLETADITCLRSTSDNDVEQQSPADVLNLGRPLSPAVQILSAQVGEQIDIKTENITPEYAEQTIVTPSEESKQEDVPTAPPAEELVQEPIEEKKVEEQKAVEASEAAIAAAVGVGVSAVSAAAVAAAAVIPTITKTEKAEKKKPTTSTKKPIGSKTTTAKPPTKTTTTTTSKVANRLSTSPRVPASKPTTAKPPTSTVPKSSMATKPSPKPRPTTVLAPKSAERKPPTMNGEVKSSVRSTLTARKVPSESTSTTKTTPRPTSIGATRSSPSKPLAPKLTSARPTSGLRTTTVTKTTTTSATTAAPKPRPTTLVQKTSSTATTNYGTRTVSATKVSPTKTSPRTTAAPKPRPPTSTTVLKPRVPLTKTVASKAPDTEKHNKDSANKLTASKTVTSTTTRAAASARTSSTTVRKVESKLSTTRTSKTTTTTMKSTTAKKPTEITRSAISKTKTTKIEKPKESNTVVVQEVITVVSDTNAAIQAVEDPQLLKDNSPLDNKLIEESALIQTNAAD